MISGHKYSWYTWILKGFYYDMKLEAYMFYNAINKQMLMLRIQKLNLNLKIEKELEQVCSPFRSLFQDFVVYWHLAAAAAAAWLCWHRAQARGN